MEGMIAEIRMFGGNFAPRSWAFCDGQLLSISQNTALFSILGTIYGGDGRTTFALPDLRGRVAMHPGNGPGLSGKDLGQRGGRETVTLTVAQLPSHNHTGSLQVGAEGKGSGATGTAAGSYLGDSPDDNYRTTAGAVGQAVKGIATNNTGASQAFGIEQPFLCVNYIIALQGIFPSRS